MLFSHSYAQLSIWYASCDHTVHGLSRVCARVCTTHPSLWTQIIAPYCCKHPAIRRSPQTNHCCLYVRQGSTQCSYLSRRDIDRMLWCICHWYVERNMQRFKLGSKSSFLKATRCDSSRGSDNTSMQTYSLLSVTLRHIYQHVSTNDNGRIRTYAGRTQWLSRPPP